MIMGMFTLMSMITTTHILMSTVTGILTNMHILIPIPMTLRRSKR